MALRLYAPLEREASLSTPEGSRSDMGRLACRSCQIATEVPSCSGRPCDACLIHRGIHHAEFGPVSSLSRPAPSDSIFISIIVKAPIVQIISMLLAFGYLALDYPAPFMKGTAIHRSFPIRIVLLLLQTFFSILYYQVRVSRRCGGPSGR